MLQHDRAGRPVTPDDVAQQLFVATGDGDLDADGVKKRNCDHLWAMCTRVTRAELRPGDLLFRSRNGDMYHVGVYVGRDRVIEAKGRDDGVVLRGIDASGAGYWNNFGRLKALQ